MFKVLHINDYPADAGGAEVVMRSTIALLRARGIAVETFTSADLTDARRTALRYLSNRHARQVLVGKLEAFRPHIVHLHNYYHVLSPGILATLAEHRRQHPLRVVMTAHDFHLVCPNSGGSWFRGWTGRREVIGPGADTLGYHLSRCWDHRSGLHSLLKLLQHGWHYRLCRRQRVIDHVICPSRFVQRMLEPTGLPTSWLPHPAPPLPHRPMVRAGPLHFVFAGRVEPEKGLAEFLTGLPADFGGRLTLVGAGSELARCQQIVAERGFTGPVQFLGRQTHAQTLARIAEAHVLVQPSRFLETYGLTLIEALAAGTNVLASNRGAAPEIVADAGVGFLYEADSSDSLAGQLREIRQRHADGTLNRFDIASFLESRSEANHVDDLLRVYEMAAPVPQQRAA